MTRTAHKAAEITARICYRRAETRNSNHKIALALDVQQVDMFFGCCRDDVHTLLFRRDR